MAYGFCHWKYLWDFFGVLQEIQRNVQVVYRTSGAGKQLQGSGSTPTETLKPNIAFIVRVGVLMSDTLWTGSARSAPAMKSAT